MHTTIIPLIHHLQSLPKNETASTPTRYKGDPYLHSPEGGEKHEVKEFSSDGRLSVCRHCHGHTIVFHLPHSLTATVLFKGVTQKSFSGLCKR